MDQSAIQRIFNDEFGHMPTLLARAPGRVNLLGEHVDYNEGCVLPAAIDRQVEIAARPTDDDIVSLLALDLKQSASFRLIDLDKRQDLHGKPLPGWALYPAGVAQILCQQGLRVSGMQALYTSNVPIGSGLSSSAAVEVGFGITWRAFGGWQAEALTLAQWCQKAENQYVGVNCGLMDQFASACGVLGHALLFDTRSLEFFPVPLPDGTAIVIADSSIRRSLATSAYNERRAACEQAVQLLKEYLPNIHSLRDISSVEFAAYSPYLPAEVSKRAEHVVKEIARVQDAVVALTRNDARLFGGLMFAGHNSLRDLYEVSCPELDVLVEIARTLPGCWGARLTGAGFGGCTVNLVAETNTEQFISGLKEQYYQRTGHTAQVYLCKASQGATAASL